MYSGGVVTSLSGSNLVVVTTTWYSKLIGIGFILILDDESIIDSVANIAGGKSRWMHWAEFVFYQRFILNHM